MLVAAAASQANASAIMKTETERHMLPRFSALGLAVAAALTVMVAAVAPAQAPWSKDELAAGIKNLGVYALRAGRLYTPTRAGSGL
jgi:hypothetical protein